MKYSDFVVGDRIDRCKWIKALNNAAIARNVPLHVIVRELYDNSSDVPMRKLILLTQEITIYANIVEGFVVHLRAMCLTKAEDVIGRDMLMQLYTGSDPSRYGIGKCIDMVMGWAPNTICPYPVEKEIVY